MDARASQTAKVIGRIAHIRGVTSRKGVRPDAVVNPVSGFATTLWADRSKCSGQAEGGVIGSASGMPDRSMTCIPLRASLTMWHVAGDLDVPPQARNGGRRNTGDHHRIHWVGHLDDDCRHCVRRRTRPSAPPQQSFPLPGGTPPSSSKLGRTSGRVPHGYCPACHPHMGSGPRLTRQPGDDIRAGERRRNRMPSAVGGAAFKGGEGNIHCARCRVGYDAPLEEALLDRVPEGRYPMISWRARADSFTASTAASRAFKSASLSTSRMDRTSSSFRFSMKTGSVDPGR